MHTEICKTCPLSKVCHPELTPTNRSNGWFHLFRKPLLSYLNCSHFLLRSEASSIERNYKLAEENGTRRNFTGTYRQGSSRELTGHQSQLKAVNAVGRVFSRLGNKWLETGQKLWGEDVNPVYPNETDYTQLSDNRCGVDGYKLDQTIKNNGLIPFDELHKAFEHYQFIGCLEVLNDTDLLKGPFIESLQTSRRMGATHFYFGENIYPGNVSTIRVELYKI